MKYFTKLVFTLFCIFSFFSCFHYNRLNPYNTLNQSKKGVFSLNESDLEVYIQDFASSLFENGKNETAMSLRTGKTSLSNIKLNTESLKLFSSSLDTFTLKSITIVNLKNHKTIVFTKKRNEIIELDNPVDKSISIIFESMKNYSEQEYRKQFKNDTIYLLYNGLKTGIALKGSYVTLERNEAEKNIK